MCRILLCDDDPVQAKQLSELVVQMLGPGTSVASCASEEALVRALKEASGPCIVLMDIELGTGVCGIEVVQRLFPEGSAVQVIYITGHIEYCTRVYETEHVSFLVKPVREAELNTALQRALTRAANTAREGIMIRSGSELRFLPFAELHFLESAGRKIKFCCGGQVYESYARLKDVVQTLDSRFYQCHKSFVVNLDWVDSCSSRDYALTDGARVPISSRYRAEAKSAFLRRLSRTVFDEV